MRISRLELHGFKSFADRNVFHFGEGISCVVGPNGCGKSNVVDALRWCIGEQSAKSLRGGEMQDVIFAGSAERKPVGYAEVALTFTSEGGEPFPGEFAKYTEIQVCRRLYRSGASEYLINQTRCRRKDIVNLFMDTGVGNNLYSFIEQGRIDKIVSASPKDRRSLIDEAAGITRYKIRRAEAMSKLEATAGQLDRAADVADEMERRLKTLERQVIKAARFRRLRALVRQEEIFLGLAKFHDLQQQQIRIGESLGKMRAESVTLEASVAKLQADLEVREGEVEVAEATVQMARDVLTELDAQRREIEATLSLHERRRDELSVQLDSATADHEAEELRVETAREELVSSAEELEQIAEEVEVAEESAEQAREALIELEEQYLELRESLREVENEANEITRRRGEVRSRLEALRRSAGELPERLARVDSRLKAGEDETVVLSKRIEVAEGVVEERQVALEEMEEQLEALEEEVEGYTRKDLHARDKVKKAELELDAAQRSLTSSMAKAEASASRAGEQMDREIARLQKTAEGELRAAEREGARRLSQKEAEARRGVESLERASRVRIESAQAKLDQELAAWRAQEEARLDEEDQRLQREIDHTISTGAEAAARAESEAREALEERLEAVLARRDAAEADLEKARHEQQNLEARQAKALKSRREVEAKISALRTEERLARTRDAGAQAVAELLPNAPRLLDAVKIEEGDREWVSATLGERLLLPVVSDQGEVRQAAEAARESGAASVLYLEGEPTVPALFRKTEVVDTLEQALALHASTGAAAVVRSTGERVDVDGVCRLGKVGDEARASMERTAEIERSESLLQEFMAQEEAYGKEATSLRARVEGGKIKVRQFTTRLEQVEKEGRAAVRDAGTSSRAQTESTVTTLRGERKARRDAARGALESAWELKKAQRDASLGQMREEEAETIASAREEMEQQVAERRAEEAEAHEERRLTMEQRISARREELRTAHADASAALSEQIETLREQVEGYRDTIGKARERAEQSARALEEIRAGREKLSRARGEHELVLVRVTAERDGAKEQAAQLVVRLEGLREEKVSLQSSLESTQMLLEEVELTADDLEERFEQVTERLEAHRAEAERGESAVQGARRQATEADAALSQRRERRVRLEAIQEGAKRQLESADERIAAGRGRIQQLQEWLTEAKSARAQASNTLDGLGTQRQEAALSFDKHTEHFAAVKKAKDEIVIKLTTDEDRLKVVQHRVLEDEQLQHQNSVEIETLQDRLDERYQVPLARWLEHLLSRSGLRLEADAEVKEGLEVGGRRVEPVDDLVLRPEMLTDEDTIRAYVERIADHRDGLRRVGDVNLTALEEYTELAERFADLDGQRNDLEESVGSIRSAIAKMNKTCRERFRETFDRVNETFQKSYPELVGGGEARLTLTDEEDLLETGVEIFVRPPGKRLQNLTLLSGGEKAMTAIALLLALFTVKPSPFCVLDEVDAPLDEANGARFNDMLIQMSSMTQFIVITHNRKTMECADTLYGITMPQAGCSSVVSVQVD